VAFTIWNLAFTTRQAEGFEVSKLTAF